MKVRRRDQKEGMKVVAKIQHFLGRKQERLKESVHTYIHKYQNRQKTVFNYPLTLVCLLRPLSPFSGHSFQITDQQGLLNTFATMGPDSVTYTPYGPGHTFFGLLICTMRLG